VTELVGGGSAAGVSGAAPACSAGAAGSSTTPTDGAVFVVHRQPLALDRFTVNDVRPRDAAGARNDHRPSE